MFYKDSKLHFLLTDLIERFGPERGGDLFALGESILCEMEAEIDENLSDTVQGHMRQSILPTIALYRALRESGLGEEAAYVFTLGETMKAAEERRDMNAWMASLPFAFQAFRLLAKPVMKKNYPADGWETQWRRIDRDIVHFDLTRCIYLETCERYGCAELCTVFCKNDEIAFEGYAPAVTFYRSGTLAEGCDRCDFHFAKGA